MKSGSKHKRTAEVIWLLASLVAACSVWVLNGAPLFYYDTFGYLEQGQKMVDLLFPQAKGAGGEGAVGAAELARGEVVGSRSAVYGFLVGILDRIAGLNLVVMAQLAAVALVTWLVGRVFRRIGPFRAGGVFVVSFPLFAASLGALPFLIAFLMPDVFTGVLLIALSLLVVAWPAMQAWEIIGALCLAFFSVTAHLSHIPIVAVYCAVAIICGVILHGRKWWVALLLTLSVLVVGIGERKVFAVAVEKVAESEVTYYPLITARLIEDGPGLDYLNDRCPNEAIATCALHEALSWSDDPYRITASHILFETSERLGSFQLMTPENQRRVAEGQYGFFLDVLISRPFGVARAMLTNTLYQARMTSVDMTIPIPVVIARAQERIEHGMASPEVGRLMPAGDWLAKVDAAHAALYALSLALVIFLVARGEGAPLVVRMFAVALLLGLLANAFVCGAISQPATRYGARAIWLVPYAAAFLLMHSSRLRAVRRKRPGTGGAA